MIVKFSKTEFQTQVLLYHKKVGEHVTRDPDVAAKSVFSKLPSCKHGRWISVGRLDVNTSGLLLFTNDGELAHRLMHPSYEIDREYAVRVLGDINDDMLTTLLTGVTLEDGDAKFLDVQEAGGKGANQWFHVLLQEGRKRVVRRLWESQGCQVSRLMRVRFGTVFLDAKTRAGRHRLLDKAELKSLYDSVKLKINH